MTIKTGNPNRNPQRAPWAFALLATLGLLVLWACHLSPTDDEDTFDVKGDTAWTHCNTVMIILQDGDGKDIDTLFNDSLKSIDQLKNLDASQYKGGSAAISIKGFYKDNSVCFEQNRTFEDGGKGTKVDTVLDKNIVPTGLKVEPKDLVLTMGSPPSTLNAILTPSYADPEVSWSLDGTGVVALEGLKDGKGNPARVKPAKAGIGSIRVRSVRDTALTFTVPVRVIDPGKGSIDIVKDTVLLYVKGEAESLKVVIPPEYSGQKLEWKTGNIDVAQVDGSGRIKPLKEGETNVQATLQPAGLTDVALVRVVLDKPVLKVNSAKGVGVGGEILFSAVVTQKFGTIVLFKYDLLGEGKFDSLTVGWSGDSVNLPAVKAKYEKEGSVKATFIVKDSEGNVTETVVNLEIGNQAPEITSIRGDTVISVKDSILLYATAKDSDGKVAWLGWDFEGDGQFDDTVTVDAAESKLERGHRYAEAGTYKAVFRAKDNNGKPAQDTAIVKVEFDAPVADAGPDQTVLAGAPVTIPVKGTDKFGKIVKREIKVGDQPFITLPDDKEEVTQNAPDKPVTVRFIIRVTDDDDLTDLDTAVVEVILSSNADLSGLTFSAGPLTPSFTPNAKTYGARVAFADSQVTVTPSVNDKTTKIAVNGDAVESGKPSRAVKLALGKNTNAFEIITTAADGTQRVYSVTVTRDPNGEATLGKLEVTNFTLSPAFAPTTLDYADTVAYDTSTVTFKPTVASAGATLSFNDTAMTSGTFTKPQDLAFGENTFKFVVTAMDGTSKSTYTVKVFRLGRLITYKKLGGSAATEVNTFNIPVGTAQQVSGATPVGWKFLKWTILEGTASFADSAATPTEATLKSGLAKVQANYEILKYDITVTSSGCGKIDPGSVTLDHGSNQKYKVTPASGCRVASFKVDGKDEPLSAADTSYTFTAVSAKHTVDVKFVRTFTLSVKVSGKGTVSPQTTTVDTGTKVTFTVKPEAGNKVAVKGICEDATKNCFDPDKDGTFSADAIANRGFTVAFVPGWRMQGSVTNGVGTISPVDSTVDNLSNVTWAWTFDLAKYRLDGVYLDGSEVKPTSATTLALTAVVANHAVEARLKRKYAMTYDVGPGGTLSPQPAFSDSMGTPQFTATPSAGYRVDTIKVDTLTPSALGSVYSGQTWTLSAVTGPTTIKVRFKRYYTITASAGSGGQIFPLSVNIDSGATQVWNIGFTAGYYLSAIDIAGDNPRSLMGNVSGGTLTLTGVAEGGAITAAFSNIYTITLTSNSVPSLSATPPRMCIVNQSAADSVCTVSKAGAKGNLSLKVTYGAKMLIKAIDEYKDCGGIVCQARYFNYFDGLKTPVTDNPYSFTGNRNYDFEAIYGDAPVR